jgi:hypothetical protein
MEVDRLGKLLKLAVEADRSMGLWLRSLALSILSERANWEATPFKPTDNIYKFAVLLARKLFDVSAYYAAGISQDNVSVKLIGAVAESNLKQQIQHEKYVRWMEAQIKETIMAVNGRQLWDLVRLLTTMDLLDVYMITSVWVIRPKMFATIYGQQIMGVTLREPMNWQKVKYPLAEIL